MASEKSPQTAPDGEKKTPLFACHEALGGKIVPFAGYLLPVQYETGVIAEHMAVRTACGLFDVSHMAELRLTGPDAARNADRLTTVFIDEMVDGQVKYSPLCNERGGIVDDLMVYRRAPDDFLFVVNAANHDKDRAWFETHLEGDVTFADVSESIAQIALQGPRAPQILARLCAPEDIPEKYYTFREGSIALGEARVPALISQTGYTGEDGYELYVNKDDAAAVWYALLAVGARDGLIPCGLGARDTLRLEAAMPLYGHEMNDDISPKEAGLGIFVKMDKPDFIGKAAIEERGAPTVKRVGLKVVGRGIVRENCDLLVGDKVVGHTTSGTHAPFLGCGIAMGYLPKDLAVVGSIVTADVRGRKIDCEIVKLPFYKKPAKAAPDTVTPPAASPKA